MIDKRIIEFIGRHHVLTLATASIGADKQVEPYCSNMFYTYLADDNLFVFTSSLSTLHARQAVANNRVALSIVRESKVVGILQGIQIMGVMEHPDQELLDRAKAAYLKRFPYAAVMPLELWTVRPTFMKLTDNKLGFGKKLIWNGNE